METFSALLAICAGNSPLPVNSPYKGQWRGALMFSLICLNKRLSKQLWGWWFETLSRPLWRHRSDKHVPPLITRLLWCLSHVGVRWATSGIEGHGNWANGSLRLLRSSLLLFIVGGDPRGPSMGEWCQKYVMGIVVERRRDRQWDLHAHIIILVIEQCLVRLAFGNLWPLLLRKLTRDWKPMGV